MIPQVTLQEQEQKQEVKSTKHKQKQSTRKKNCNKNIMKWNRTELGKGWKGGSENKQNSQFAEEIQ